MTDHDEVLADCLAVASADHALPTGHAETLTATPRISICDTLAIAYPRFDALFMARKALGLQRYGVELDPFTDRRDMLSESIEEIADGMVYLRAAIEQEATRTRINGRHKYLTMKLAADDLVRALDRIEEARES